MTKIRIMEHISLDGVIQASGGPAKTATTPTAGVVISTYRPSGPLRTGSFDDGEA